MWTQIDVRPVAQRVRWVPFALREKVETKVEELLKAYIIERVQGPTIWANPVAVAPKPSGEIRPCVDMRQTNESIIRKRLPIPTVDEVLERTQWQNCRPTEFRGRVQSEIDQNEVQSNEALYSKGTDSITSQEYPLRQVETSFCKHLAKLINNSDGSLYTFNRF